MENEKKMNLIKDEDLDQVTGGARYDDHVLCKDDVNIPEPDPVTPFTLPMLVNDDSILPP